MACPNCRQASQKSPLPGMWTACARSGRTHDLRDLGSSRNMMERIYQKTCGLTEVAQCNSHVVLAVFPHLHKQHTPPGAFEHHRKPDEAPCSRSRSPPSAANKPRKRLAAARASPRPVQGTGICLRCAADLDSSLSSVLLPNTNISPVLGLPFTFLCVPPPSSLSPSAGSGSLATILMQLSLLCPRHPARIDVAMSCHS